MKDDSPSPELPGMPPPPDISEIKNRGLGIKVHNTGRILRKGFQVHNTGMMIRKQFQVYATKQILNQGYRRLSKEEARFYELHNRLPNKEELKQME